MCRRDLNTTKEQFIYFNVSLYATSYVYISMTKIQKYCCLSVASKAGLSQEKMQNPGQNLFFTEFFKYQELVKNQEVIVLQKIV